MILKSDTINCLVVCKNVVYIVFLTEVISQKNNSKEKYL